MADSGASKICHRRRPLSDTHEKQSRPKITCDLNPKQRDVRIARAPLGRVGTSEPIDGARRHWSCKEFFTCAGCSRDDVFRLRIGAVIEILWQKPCPELSKIKRECFSASEDPYSRPRRFVVVGSRPGYFNALPIMTYNGQGVSEAKVRKSEHCIIYTGVTPPSPDKGEQPAADEEPMKQYPIRVQPKHYSNTLPRMSRLNLCSVWTMKSDITVKKFGEVDLYHLDMFKLHFLQASRERLKDRWLEQCDVSSFWKHNSNDASQPAAAWVPEPDLCPSRSSRLVDKRNEGDSVVESCTTSCGTGCRMQRPSFIHERAEVLERTGSQSISRMDDTCDLDANISDHGGCSSPESNQTLSDAVCEGSFRTHIFVTLPRESNKLANDFQEGQKLLRHALAFRLSTEQVFGELAKDRSLQDMISQLLQDFTTMLKLEAQSKRMEIMAALLEYGRDSFCTYILETLNSVTTHNGQLPSGKNSTAIVPEWYLDRSWEDIRVPNGRIMHPQLSQKLSLLDICEVAEYMSTLDNLNSLFTGKAYQWLIWQLRAPLTRAIKQSPQLMCIRKSFLASLADISSSPGADVHSMLLELDWNAWRYMMDEFGSQVDLGATVVVVGSVSYSWATTCRDYLSKTWPKLGCGVLDAVNDAVAAKGGSIEGQIEGVSLHIHNHLEMTWISATGHLIYLCEIFEILVWMGTACRSSHGYFPVSSAIPSLSRLDSAKLEFKIDYVESLEINDTDAGSCATCWHAMFQNAVIAEGYPIPGRQCDERGMEVSLNLMTTLARTSHRVLYEGRVLLKGYNTILVLVKAGNESAQWHFIKCKDNEERITYNEISTIPRLRKVYGTTKISYSSLDHSKSREGKHRRARDQILRIRKIEAGNLEFLVGSKEGSKEGANLSEPVSFEKRLENAGSWTVLFSDTGTQRHWLLDGATAILYLVQSFLASQGTSEEFFADEHDLLPVQHKPSQSYASRVLADQYSRGCSTTKVVNNHQSRKTLVGGTNESDAQYPSQSVQDIIMYYWHVLELLYDHAQSRQESEPQDWSLEGFELRDLTCWGASLRPRTLDLAKNAMSWLRGLRKIGTINLFGSGLGDMIMPEAGIHQVNCQFGKRMPTGNDFLAIPMSILRTVAERLSRSGNGIISNTKGGRWRNLERGFQMCNLRDPDYFHCDLLINALDFCAETPDHCTDKDSVPLDHPLGAIVVGRFSDDVERLDVAQLSSEDTMHPENGCEVLPVANGDQVATTSQNEKDAVPEIPGDVSDSQTSDSGVDNSRRTSTTSYTAASQNTREMQVFGQESTLPLNELTLCSRLPGQQTTAAANEATQIETLANGEPPTGMLPMRNGLESNSPPSPTSPPTSVVHVIDNSVVTHDKAAIAAQQRLQQDRSILDPENDERTVDDTDFLPDRHTDQTIHFVKLVRRTRKLADTILLKRTQWRHEIAQFQQCKDFRNASADELHEAMQQMILDRRQYASQMSRSSQRATAEAFASGETPSDPLTAPPHRLAMTVHDTGLDQQIASATNIQTVDTSFDYVEDVYRRFREDAEAARTQEDKAIRLGDELSNLEYQHGLALEALQNRISAKNFVSELKSDIMQIPVASSEGSNKSSEAEIPSIVAQYFNVKGDVGIYQERLQECEYAHLEGLTEREFLRERGDTVSPSDDEFEENYQARRNEIVQDLRAAEADSEILRQRCVDAGLDPDHYRHSRSAHLYSPQESDQAISEFDLPPLATQDIPVIPLATSTNIERRSAQRIDQWLRSIKLGESDASVEPEPLDTPSSEEEEKLDLTMSATTTNSLAAYESQSFDAELFMESRRKFKGSGSEIDAHTSVLRPVVGMVLASRAQSRDS